MTELAQLALRAALAVIFVAHGAQKLFGWWGGGIESTTQLFQALGLEPAHFLAIVCGLVELGAGIMLAVGLLTRLAALAIVVDMCVAMAYATWPYGFFDYSGGIELNVIVAVAALAVFLLGPGPVSLDALLARTGPTDTLERWLGTRPSTRW
jgi:putative oxidoreductase